MEQPAARDVTHEARRGRRNARALDARADIIEHRGRVPALFRELRVEPLAENFHGRPQARRGFHLVEKGERVVQRLRSQRPAFFRVRLERRGPFAQPANLGAQLLDHAIRRAASTA